MADGIQAYYEAEQKNKTIFESENPGKNQTYSWGILDILRYLLRYLQWISWQRGFFERRFIIGDTNVSCKFRASAAQSSLLKIEDIF